MSTLLSLLKEKMFNFRAPQNKALSDARAESRELAQETKLELEEAKVESLGNVSKVEAISSKLCKLEEKKAFKLFDQLVQVRLMIAKHLKLLSWIKYQIEHDLEKDASLSAEQKKQLQEQFTQEFNKIQSELAGIINNIFQAETSFENTSFALKQLQDMSAKTRELSYNYLKAKRTTRQTNRDEKQLLKSSRNAKDVENPEFIKRLRLYEKHLVENADYLKKASSYTIQLLRDDVTDITQKKKHFEQLISESGFPKEVGSNIITNYDSTLHKIHDELQAEIAKKRIELSSLARAA